MLYIYSVSWVRTCTLVPAIRPMIESAWRWATAHGCLRKNPVHGEEEAKLVLSDTFDLVDSTGTETQLSGSFEAEDSC